LKLFDHRTGASEVVVEQNGLTTVGLRELHAGTFVVFRYEIRSRISTRLRAIVDSFRCREPVFSPAKVTVVRSRACRPQQLLRHK
jgi:hypothetical protein